MLVVCGIIFAVTFVERLPSNATAVAAIADAWMRLLEYVPLFLPPAVFMGTLLASYNLTKSSEMIIVSSAGLSPYQAARPFLFGAALIGIFATTVINPYSVDLRTQNLTHSQLKLVDDAIWLRDKNDHGFITMQARGMHMAQNDLVFHDVLILAQDPSFRLTQRVMADTIQLGADGLQTHQANIWDAQGVKTTGPFHASTSLTAQTVLDRYMQPDQISFWQLPSFIHKMESVGVPMRGHWVQFWTLLFLPLTMIAMATLGIAFSQTKQRRNYSFGVKFSLGVVTCFAVYFLTNMFSALGATGVLPAVLAIVAPPLIIIAGAGVFMATFDTI